MKNSKIKIINIFKVVSILLVLILNLAMLPVIKAGEYQDETDVMTRLKASTLSSHDITFDLSAGTVFGATSTITVDFNTGGFSVNGASSTVSDFAFSDSSARTIYSVSTSTPNCVGTASTTSIAVGIVSNVVTFKACTGYATSTAAASVEIKIGTAAGGTDRVTNPALGDNIPIYLAGTGTVGDTGSLAVSILSDDQIVVTATVEPSFTFTISTSTCALGTLSTAATSSCSYTATTTSNASDGYITSMVAASKLVSGSNDIDDVTDGAVTATAEEYGIRVTGTNAAYATSTDMLVPLTTTTIASDGSGPINQATTITHIAAISGTTLAGSYSQTVTLISTGTY